MVRSLGAGAGQDGEAMDSQDGFAEADDSGMSLADETEETEDLDPEEPSDTSGAWQRYDLWTMPDGSIQGRTATNDNLDRGYPNDYEEWDVSFKNKEAMLKQLGGGSHYGVRGVRVEVVLDGAEVGEPLLRRGSERLL